VSRFFQDIADPTKRVDFVASAISSGATRIITMPNQDLSLGSIESSTARRGTKYSAASTVVGQAKVQTLTDGATISWDVDNGYTATVTLAGNRTLAAITNLEDGDTAILRVVQDATGSRTLSYAAGGNFRWSGGTPVLSTAANAVDILSFVKIGGSTYGSIGKAFA
jgi:hypothetical protein